MPARAMLGAAWPASLDCEGAAGGLPEVHDTPAQGVAPTPRAHANTRIASHPRTVHDDLTTQSIWSSGAASAATATPCCARCRAWQTPCWPLVARYALGGPACTRARGDAGCTVCCDILVHPLHVPLNQDGRLCFTDARSLEPRGGLALGADVPALALNPTREHELFAAAGPTIYRLDLRKVWSVLMHARGHTAVPSGRRGRGPRAWQGPVARAAPGAMTATLKAREGHVWVHVPNSHPPP